MERIDVLQYLVLFFSAMIVALLYRPGSFLKKRIRGLSAQEEINRILEERIKDTQEGVMDHDDQLLELHEKIFELNQSLIAERHRASNVYEVATNRHDGLKKDFDTLTGSVELLQAMLDVVIARQAGEPDNKALEVLGEALSRCTDYPIKE